MKRLYLRRRGAHCCCASPITRISSTPSGDTLAFDAAPAGTRDPDEIPWSEVEGEKASAVTSRGS